MMQIIKHKETGKKVTVLCFPKRGGSLRAYQEDS